MLQHKKTTTWIVIFTFFVSLMASTGVITPYTSLAYDAPPKDQGHTGPNPTGENPTGPQNDPNQSDGGDPVQSKTGNFTFEQEDLFLLGLGGALSCKRYYNSYDLYDGPFGYGWNHSFNISIIEVSDGDVTIRDGDGIRYSFSINEDGSYTSPKGRFLELVKTGSNSFNLFQKDRMEYVFNDSRVVSITDPNGNTRSYNYLGDGKLSKVINQSGRWIEFSYGPNNKVLTATDNIGRTVTYQYDQNNNLVSVTNPLGNATSFSYDSNHRLLTVHDAKGNLRIQNTYDTDGRVTQQLSSGGTFVYTYYDGYTRVRDRKGSYIYHYFNGDGNPIRDVNELSQSVYQTWNADMQLSQFKDANGRATNYAYDDLGNLITVTDALNNSTKFTYHPTFHHISTVTDAFGRTTSYSYDEKGNLTQKTDALGNITSYEYNSAGQPIKTFDEAGREILLGYDQSGDLTSITDNQNNVTRFEYDGAGRRTKYIDPLGNTTTYTYDALDRLVQQTGPSGEVAAFVFDEVGNIIKGTDPNGNSITREYDAYGRLVGVTDALGNSTRYEYDLNDNLTATVDALNRQTSMSYDKANRLVGMTRPDGLSISFGYDAIGNNTSITDASGNSTQFTYDAANRLIKTTYADGSSETRSYDAVGNVVTFKDRGGNDISFQYDATDRLIQKKYPSSEEINIIHNELGFVQSVSNSMGTIYYTYDSLDRLTQVKDVFGRNVNYQYDAVGRRISMTDSLGGSLSYNFDASSRLLSVGRPSGQVNFSYDPGGRIIQRQLPNGIISRFSYDTANHLTSLQHSQADDSIIDRFLYQYDAVGNKIHASTVDGAYVEYQYDNLNQLIQETRKDINDEIQNNIQYGYDANSNRISLISDGVQTDFTYNNFNQLISAGNASYSYDGNGNLKSIIEGTDQTLFSYDDRNLLTKTVLPDGTFFDFDYDGTGRCVAQADGASEIRFVFDKTALIAETNTSNVVQSRFEAANGMISLNGATGLLFYLSDGQGSTRYLVDYSGNIVNGYSYDAFGNVINQTGNADNPFTFSANYGYYQVTNGSFLIGSRYYLSSLGRFLQVDPLYQGTNWYSYALNDPVNLVDPTGEWVHILVGAGIGAGVNTAVYLISTPRSQWSWGGGLRAGATGAIVGGVGAATFGASLPATLGGAVVRGAAAGLTTTLAGDLTNSAFDQKLQFSSPYTYATNAAIGGIISGGTYGIGKAVQNYRSLQASKSGDVKVLGRLDDTAVAKNWKGHDVLDIPDWTMQKNMKWVDQGIKNKQNFYTASPEAGNMIQTTGRFKGQPTVYAQEIQRVKDAGYIKVGDYYVHPDNVGTFKP